MAAGVPGAANLVELVSRAVERFPDSVAFTGDDGTLTYRALHELSCRIANGLCAAGIGKGAKVGVYSPNSSVSFACVLGVLRAGAAWVPLNARNLVSENIALVQLTETDCLFVHSEFAAQVAEAAAEVPSLRLTVGIDAEVEGCPSLSAWAASFSTDDPAAAATGGDLAILLGTGGTTGRPKGVMLTHGNLLTMSAVCNDCMPASEPPVNLVVAPMTHAAGVLLFPMLALGATNVILPRPDPLEILSAIERERVTNLFLPPTVIYLLLAHPRLRDFDYSSLRYFVYAAAPISTEKLKEAISVFGGAMAQLFGQTEAPMMCTYLSPEDHVRALASGQEHRLRSCGRPTSAVELAVMGDDESLLGPDERGEIVVRGDLVTPGYYKDPEATAAARSHGWHLTGDIGYVDDDGFVYLVDRKKDLIISGGFNIYPSEIEQLLWAHPAVQDCAVIGVPDAKWGEAVKAVVELKPGCSATESELIAFCKERLGSVKSPKSVEFRDRLPRSAVGKVLKKDIRAPYWQGQWRSI